VIKWSFVAHPLWLTLSCPNAVRLQQNSDEDVFVLLHFGKQWCRVEKQWVWSWREPSTSFGFAPHLDNSVPLGPDPFLTKEGAALNGSGKAYRHHSINLSQWLGSHCLWWWIKKEHMPVWDSQEERSCDPLVMSAVETGMRDSVLCVRPSPSQGPMSSVMPGFRMERQCSPTSKSIYSSTNSLIQVPALG